MQERFEKIAFFENVQIDCINYIFVSDRTILILNQKYLSHTYPTDIITFDNSILNCISGDIYISLDTVKFNSRKFNTDFRSELNRVMIHGILHLIGYKDKASSEKVVMRKKENYYLQLFNF
jgi:probable rRNA maturation factor